MAEGARITIDAQLQFRHDVEANWLAADPILKVGEPAYTIGYSDRFKLGDGQSKWSELPYLQLVEGGGGGGSQAYESLAWSAIKTLTSGDASVLAQAYAVKQAYNELKSLIPNLADYYTKEQINALIPSLEGYATEAWVLDRGYLTSASLDALEQAVDNNATDIGDHENRIATIEGNYALKSSIPTSLSDLANDVGYITAAALGGLASESWVSNNFLGLGGGTMNGMIYAYGGVEVKDATYPAVQFRMANDGNVGWLWYNGGDRWGVTNHGWTEQYNLIHSGNIGSQSVNSATKLQTARTIWGQSFDGTGNVDGYMFMSGLDVLRLDNSSLWLNYGAADGGKSLRLCGNDVAIYYGKSSNFARAMTINSAGNVLIGTTTDNGAKLQVSGVVKAKNSFFIDRYGDHTYWANGFYIRGEEGTGWGIGAYSNDKATEYYYIGDYGSEMITIKPNGNIGIGTIDPQYKFDSMGKGRFQSGEAGVLSIKRLAAGGALIDYYSMNQESNRWRVGSSDQYSFIWEYNGTDKMSLSNSGNLTASGEITALGSSSSSDRRLKDIVSRPKPLTLEDIAKLNVISFKWNHRENDKRLKIGLVAQEVQEILPELVGVDRSNFLTLDYSTFGSIVGVLNTKKILSLEEEVIALRNEVKELRRKIYG